MTRHVKSFKAATLDRLDTQINDFLDHLSPDDGGFVSVQYLVDCPLVTYIAVLVYGNGPTVTVHHGARGGQT